MTKTLTVEMAQELVAPGTARREVNAEDLNEALQYLLHLRELWELESVGCHACWPLIQHRPQRA